MSFGEIILSLIVFSVIPVTFWLSHKFRDVEDDARKMAGDKRQVPYGRTGFYPRQEPHTS